MNCVVWCHAHLLHIAISIIDDHYSFSLKSVREKYCKLHVNNSRYDTMMPLKIEKKCSFFFFPGLWKGEKHQHLLKKNLLHSLFFCGNATANCHPVNPQWSQTSLRICWVWCGNNRLRMSWSEASNMQHLWSQEQSRVPLHTPKLLSHTSPLSILLSCPSPFPSFAFLHF